MSRILSYMLSVYQQISTIWLQCILLFSLVWGLGSTMTNEGRRKFDTFFRELINGENKQFPKPKNFTLSQSQLFPDKASIFEWIFDKRNNGSWIPWVDFYDKVQISAHVKPHEFLVQTNESCCQKYFLNLCLATNIPLILMGPTGTGKSAVILDHLLHVPNETFLVNVLNFSACTTSAQV